MKKLETLFLAFFAAAFLVACSDDDGNGGGNETPDPTAEELEMAAADRFFAANSVIRALAFVDELPENWESSTFEPVEGVAINEANPDIRYVVSLDVEQARSYFLSIVPDEGLSGDTWMHEGVGTLTFKTVNEDDCYAVIDVNLLQMPGLKQLRFVPKDVVGDNKYYGEGYYKLGDVVRDTKGHIWICVRPSGGPLGKGHAYFVSFDKTLIKTKRVAQTIYDVDDAGRLTKNVNTKLSGTWTFATNLVDEATAIAAGHAFAMMVWGSIVEGEDAKTFSNMGEYLESHHLFNADWLSSSMTPLGYKPENSPVFCIPYGSYKSYKHPEVTQVKNIQPLMLFHIDAAKQDPNCLARQFVLKTWPNAQDINKPTKYVYTLTSDYDPLAYHVFNPDKWDGEDYGYAKNFDILDYATDHIPFDKKYLRTPQSAYFNNRRYNPGVALLMVQKRIKDEGKEYSGFDLLTDYPYAPKYWEMLDFMKRMVYEPKSWGNTYPPYD